MDEQILQLLETVNAKLDDMNNRLTKIEDEQNSSRVEITRQFDDLKTQINTLEHRVITLDKTIRIVYQQYSDLKLDVELMKQDN